MSDHNHQATDGYDYEGCPACIAHGQRERVFEAASEVYSPEGVALWMQAPNPSLNNATPAQSVAAGDIERVLQVLDQLASGAFG